MEKKRCPGCMKEKTQTPVCEHCGYNENVPNYPHQLAVGTILRGQYTVGKVLGQGGFGITYIGWDESLESPVAIKEFYPNSFVTRDSATSSLVNCISRNAEALYTDNRERFLREARVLAKLQNVPGIVRVHNLFTENNTAYIVMEYVEGIDLKHYIRSRNRLLTVEEAFAVLRPVMYALSKVHDAELVHRDISPDNIMIQTDGTAKLLDFGAAREVENAEVDKDLPQSTEAILKHGFAPMEQYRRRGSLGPWTDVYALCATLYYCLTGKVPNSAPERIMGDDNVSWRQIPGLSEQQIQTLEKGLALMPEDRIRTMRELHNGLFGQAATGFTQAKKEEAKKEPEKKAEKKPDYPTHTVSLEEPSKPKKKKKPFGLIAAALAVVAAVGIFALKPREEVGTTTAPEEKPSISATEPAFTLPLSEEEKQYLAAAALEKAGEYGKAAIAFGKLGDYQDARERSLKLWDKVAIRKTIAASEKHTVAVKTDGTVVAVGDNTNGICNVESWTDIIAVEAGRNYTFGLCSDGSVVAVGSESNKFREAPDVSNWKDIVAIATNMLGTTVIGLKLDGTVISTGNLGEAEAWTDLIAVCPGIFGVKADGTVVTTSNQDWAAKTAYWTNIVAIESTGVHVVGLKSDGTVIAAGNNQQGQCDVENWQDIIAIDTGTAAVVHDTYGTVGLKKDGTVVAAGDLHWTDWYDVSTFSAVAAVSTSAWHTVALRHNGTVVAVGGGMDHQCDVEDWTDIKLPG